MLAGSGRGCCDDIVELAAAWADPTERERGLGSGDVTIGDGDLEGGPVFDSFQPRQCAEAPKLVVLLNRPARIIFGTVLA